MFNSFFILFQQSSKSSCSSLYALTFSLIFDLFRHVMKSSCSREMIRAGSKQISGPMRTCPCSMNSVAILSVCAIFSFIITTGKRRLQNADAVTFSASCKLSFVEISPMLKSDLVFVQIFPRTCRACRASLSWRTLGIDHSVASL